MTQLIKEERKLEKNNEGYKWHSLYESQINEEEFQKNLDFFKNRVRLLKKEIKNNNPEILKKQKEAYLKKQKEIKEHALRHFDQYWEEELEKMSKKREEEKEILKTFIDKYKEVKKEVLKQVKKEAKARIESYKIQLDDAEKNLNIYKNAKK